MQFIDRAKKTGWSFEAEHTFASIMAAINAAETDTVPETLCKLGAGATLSKTEMELLAKAAGKKAGVSYYSIKGDLNNTRQKHRRQSAERKHEAYVKNNPKFVMEDVRENQPILPTTLKFDEILSKVKRDEPPMRDAYNWPTKVFVRKPSGLFTLTPKGSNAEEEGDSRLPAPEMPLLTRITMPLVLPDGTLLATNGLNRELQTVFRIDPELLGYMPRPEDCTDEAIAGAFKFLCDEWLIDVQADTTGKCILIAYVLSILERILFPERPGFFVKSGRRGTGKTTALRMCVLAATGKEPPAAAWAQEENERRKALFAYLLSGIPTLVWDNIPRGSKIPARLSKAL